jgi:hypothetical protein
VGARGPCADVGAAAGIVTLRGDRVYGEDIAGAEAAAEPPPDTLAALLTASLSVKLADAVSELVGAAYSARILRIEPHADGGAEILVAFAPPLLSTR